MICSSLHLHRKSPYCSLNVFPEEGVISQRVSPQQPGKESPLSSMQGHKVGFASSLTSVFTYCFGWCEGKQNIVKY